MGQRRRTTIGFGWMMLGVVACGGGDGKATDSAAGAAAPAGAAPKDSAAAGAPGVAASGTARGAHSAPAGAGSPSSGAPTGAGSTSPSVPLGTSAATGVFTAAQAAHGREVYANACASCHMTTQHSGATFASTWNNRRVFDLYDILYNTMPLDDPGSLSDQEYVDVVAYILQLNGHPAGKATLPADPAALKALRIDIRTSAGQ